jgi:hypothetical protein
MAEYNSAILYIFPIRIIHIELCSHLCYLQNCLNDRKILPMAYDLRQVQTPIRTAKNDYVRRQSVQKYQTEIKHDR